MTEEQYKVLEKYEQTLNNALRNSFLRMTPNEFNEVAEVYDQLFTPLRKTQRACNTCRLNALKTLGRAYNAEKEKRLAEEAKKERERIVVAHRQRTLRKIGNVLKSLEY